MIIPTHAAYHYNELNEENACNKPDCQNCLNNPDNIISINITIEHLLAILTVIITLFFKAENFNITNFISKDITDISEVLNILDIFKKEESKFDIDSIMNIINKTKNEEDQSEVSNENIKSDNLTDIIKKAIELANELKKNNL